MFAYALTIFIGAFLLFQVQPLIGKYILPWFGGGPGVWTTCLLFFQMLLLGGYGYAHVLSRTLKPRAQAIMHVVLLAGALALLPITPADSWKPGEDGNPTGQILVLLAACLGLPYFVVSSTGPLMQQWFSRAKPGASPYRLYALSNAGSLLALVSYPFVVEPQFTRKAQAELWAWGFGAYALGSGWCAVKSWRANLAANSPAASLSGAAGSTLSSEASIFSKLLWLLLPACAAVLLLATTNKMCQDVAVIPFLWVLPLALYLLSFVICFDHPRWYVRPLFALALTAVLGGMCWVLFEGPDASLRLQLGVLAAGLFVCCMVCHGELYRLRPDPRQLTAYYLIIAAGGALGGLFVAVVAPRIFTDYYELHWGLLLCGLLFCIVCLRAGSPTAAHEWRWLACALTLAGGGGLDRALVWLHQHHPTVSGSAFTALRVGVWSGLGLIVALWILRGGFQKFRFWRLLAGIWLATGVVVLSGAVWVQARQSQGQLVFRSRNFYGTLKVLEYNKDDPEGHYFLLQHGRVTHGLQFASPARAAWPTTYYADGSGIALAMHAPSTGGRRIGVVGLGTGTLAAHSRAGDTLRFYEIDPDVQRLATSRFAYLSNCPAKVEMVLGDARLSLERESSQHFDLLVLDAFSSDAIPVHLLTKEAFELYGRHLKTNGLIAVHISNHFLDLEPVVVNLAHHFSYRLASITYEEGAAKDDEADTKWWAYASTWILLTHSGELINSPAIHHAASAVKTNAPKIPLWTDDFASLFQIVQ